MSRKFDAAALLIAILTVAVTPLTTVGPWDKMNTIVAVVVGVILVAFTWPRTANPMDKSGEIPLQDGWIVAALAIAYGLIITIGSAWLVQSILHPPACPEHSDNQLPSACVRADEVAGNATNWALGIGLVAAVMLFFCLRARVRTIAAARIQDSQA